MSRDTWSLELVTPASDDILALDEAKAHLRIPLDLESDDDYVRTLLMAVKDWVEGVTGKAFLTQTFKLHLDRFYGSNASQLSSNRYIYLPRPPLQSVTSVTYQDTSNATQTLAASSYVVVGARTSPDQHAPCGYILPAYGSFWPVTYPMPDTVAITYVAGFLSTETVPQRVKQAMLLLLGDMYENRERTVVGATASVLDTAELLLANETCHQQFNY